MVAYPDSTYTSFLRKIKDRNGSVGGEILKRFNIILDYSNARMVIKPNSNFKKIFSYNKSGLEVENEGVRLVTEYEPNTISNIKDRRINTINVQAVYTNTRKFIVKKAYTISFVRPDSPAARVGLQKGDVIIKINGNDSNKFSLQELIYKFYDKQGKSISMEVERLGKRIKVIRGQYLITYLKYY
ncbi:MAG: PDZ domain-containing protein [Lacinutrix sp.]|uniref:PDZ domain-containing protein n=1 Tax=Lacinutrix sp. TaxID=1937692 RepID=UPI0030B05454